MARKVPQKCKTQFKACMERELRTGPAKGMFKRAGRKCMTQLQRCRGYGKRKAKGGARKRKGRCLKWAKGRTRCLKRAA